jgi:hypothetical protein
MGIRSSLRLADTRARQNDLNSRIAWKQLQKILAARTVVFKLFLQLAIKVDGELLEKHKRIWLLFQSQAGFSTNPASSSYDHGQLSSQRFAPSPSHTGQPHLWHS